MIDLPGIWPLVFLLGAAVGSFLNVVVLRTHAGTSWLAGRSKCPHCQATLRWWEMIPVLSWVALRGRCRHCRTRLAEQYLIMEFATGLVFTLVWLAFGPQLVALTGWAVASAMLLIAVYDLRWKVIPDQFTIALALVALPTAILMNVSLIDIILGAGLGAGFFWLQYIISRKTWIGSGDILLGGALGLLLGWRMLGLGLMLAYFLGAAVAVILLLSRQASQNSSIAFGPFLIVGSFLSWLYGQQIIDWYFYHAIFR